MTESEKIMLQRMDDNRDAVMTHIDHKFEVVEGRIRFVEACCAQYRTAIKVIAAVGTGILGWFISG